MMSLSATSPSRNRFTLYIISIAVWALFLSTQESVSGSKISSLILSNFPYIQQVIRFYGVLSALSFFHVLRNALTFNPGFVGMLAMVLAIGTIIDSLSPIGGILFASALLACALFCDSITLSQITEFKNGAIEVKRELKRIDWPSHGETLKFVGVVAAFVTVSSLFWWIMDGVITRVLSFLLQLLS